MLKTALLKTYNFSVNFKRIIPKAGLFKSKFLYGSSKNVLFSK